jgi:tetratricopeptide (TPR) repeat protein
MAYSVIVAASLCAMLCPFNKKLELDLNRQKQILAHLDALSIHTVTPIDDQWPFFIRFWKSQESALTVIGRFLRDYGHPRRALKWLERATNDYWENLGHDHLRTQIALDDLGLVLYVLGRLEEAETCLRQVTNSQQRSEAFNAEGNEEMLNTRANLSLIFNAFGRNEEAEILQREALKSKEALLERIILNTIITLMNLPMTLCDTNKYEDAEKICREALRFQKEVSEEDHPRTLSTMHDLGVILWRRGKLDEAQRMTKPALDMITISLGQDHPKTIRCSQALGRILWA